MGKVLQVLAVAVVMIALIMWRFGSEAPIIETIDKLKNNTNVTRITPDLKTITDAASNQNSQVEEKIEAPEPVIIQPKYGYLSEDKSLYSDATGSVLVTRIPAKSVVKIEQFIAYSNWVLVRYKNNYGALLKSDMILDTDEKFPFKKQETN